MLVPHYAIGGVIGRGGEIVRQLRESSGATIRVSADKQFFPGTPLTERPVILSGTLDSLHSSIRSIMAIIDQESERNPNPERHDRARDLHLAIPSVMAARFVGKAGVNIVPVERETGARIVLSPRDGAEGGPLETVVRVKGPRDAVLAACVPIAVRIMDDPASSAFPEFHMYESGNAGPPPPHFSTPVDATGLHPYYRPPPPPSSTPLLPSSNPVLVESRSVLLEAACAMATIELCLSDAYVDTVMSELRAIAPVAGVTYNVTAGPLGKRYVSIQGEALATGAAYQQLLLGIARW
ncbi:RNA-binding protein Nova-2-like [Oscarella lobularis]|uniref:RNA-binding protein Nova-2-like n=1 Tax=Oscarella lobularis TaxID=121494 RepID=UPI00331432F6